MTKESAWSFGVITCLAITMIVGGTSLPSRESFLLISILNLGLLSAGLWRLRTARLPNQAHQALLIMSAVIALLSIQLIPLPQELWSNLAGRHFVSEVFATASLSNTWMPLSLAPSATRADLLSLLPAIAAFVAALALPEKNQYQLALMIAAVAALNIIAGFSQTPNNVGLFANQNFYGAFLYCAIGFVFFGTQHFVKKSMGALPVAIAAALLMFAAIGTTGSRLSLILAVACMAACVWAALDKTKSKSKLLACSIGALACAAVLGGSVLSRVAELQTAIDFRSTLFSTSIEAASAFFPFGSGFGSFVPVYQLFENPSDLQSHYINHAHNDWVELAIEGGLPTLILGVAFIWWFARTAIAAWDDRAPSNLAYYASLSVMALMVHSLFDYPLRTASLMSIFGLCCGLLAISKREQSFSKPASAKFESSLR